ncbi:uncharacterized protein BO97DRAFT_423316 [Aspergillus homomorphus CBS 101889]|uniref:Uncharacterized protein n=1 Tax=Aspergillus homomorphus (strain CBS 101889) TaxID=1450537 RepID=A0A395I1X9_ASPHC|nr:hypothetical protein BO97DRAFT_423316 [Aspergillus homomorphus CBS 101889]RAL13937.1 hypothetical protein BO97DRAFT_423316 [Aspergillus homomorphus CBS 101889]
MSPTTPLVEEAKKEEEESRHVRFGNVVVNYMRNVTDIDGERTPTDIPTREPEPITAPTTEGGAAEGRPPAQRPVGRAHLEIAPKSARHSRNASRSSSAERREVDRSVRGLIDLAVCAAINEALEVAIDTPRPALDICAAIHRMLEQDQDEDFMEVEEEEEEE